MIQIVNTRTHARKRVHTHTHVRTHIHTHTHTHIHTHLYIAMCNIMCTCVYAASHSDKILNSNFSRIVFDMEMLVFQELPTTTCSAYTLINAGIS